MKTIDTFFNRMMDVCIFLAKIMLVGMTAIVCTAVFCRYVLNVGIKWSDEVSMLLMVWFGFICMAYGVQQKLHLSMEVFYNCFPRSVQKVFTKITFAVVMFLGIVMTVFGILLMKSTMHNVMTATRWPSATLYAMVPVSGILIAYFSFADLIEYHSGYSDKEKGETE